MANRKSEILLSPRRQGFNIKQIKCLCEKSSNQLKGYCTSSKDKANYNKAQQKIFTFSTLIFQSFSLSLQCSTIGRIAPTPIFHLGMERSRTYTFFDIQGVLPKGLVLLLPLAKYQLRQVAKLRISENKAINHVLKFATQKTDIRWGSSTVTYNTTRETAISQRYRRNA